MKTMTVAEFKSQFSEVLQTLKSDEEIAVSYGKKHFLLEKYTQTYYV